MITVAVVGGGLAGLATAYHLTTGPAAAHLRCIVVERDPRFGGKVRTDHLDGFTVESGPDAFLSTKPAALDLCHRLGLDASLIPTNRNQRKLYVLSRGRPVEVPPGVNLMVPTRLGPLFRSPLLSPWGKLRLALEPLIPPRRAPADESMASFVRRRLGDEVLDRLAAPLLAGVYAGDPEKLSIHATFRRFPDDEAAHGSLIRAARRAAASSSSPKSWTPFVSLRGGVQQLIAALVAHLPTTQVMLGQTVTALTRAETGHRLHLADGRTLAADAVVLATPSFAAADLLAGLDPALADLLRRQRHVSTAAVTLGFRRVDVPHPLDGFGLVIPPRERRALTACTWASTKFPGRAPADHALLRCFVGRDGAEQHLALDDANLIDTVRAELRSILDIDAPPVLSHVVRWPRGMPQYDVGHHTWVAAVEQALNSHPGLYLTGAAYRGIGLPDIARDAEATARAIERRFASSPEMAAAPPHSTR